MTGLDHLLFIAAAGAFLSLSYLLFVIMSGALGAPLIAGSVLEGLQQNVELARRAFLLCAWVALLAALVRYFRTESVAYVTLAAGVTCFLLLPWLVRTHVPPSAAAPLMAIGQSLVESFQTSGALMMALGFVRAVVGRVVALSTGPTTGAITRAPGFASAMAELGEETPAGRPSLMRHCWELHFCRGSLRANCPRYAEQVSCWKRRSGCYCDQGLATRLLSSIGERMQVQVADEIRPVHARAQQYRSGGAKPAGRGRPGRRPRAPCGQCPIYQDHQKYKYRALSWLAYPAAAAIIGLLLPRLRYGYEWLDSYLSQRLAVPLPIMDNPIQEAQWLSAENAIILLVGILVAAVLLQLTELAIFRLKL